MMYYYKQPKKSPSYKFSDFKKACRKKNRNNLVIIYDALEDADKYFNLRTKDQILDFIYNDGLENKIFINTKLWEQNPEKNKPIMVDSYKFETGNKRGYIAFMCNNKLNHWIIKSFHLPEDMNDQMYHALKESNILKQFNLDNGGKI